MAGGIVGEFFDLKAETEAELLAMQCGDFYEFFDEDAQTVADELDLNISQKSSHGSSYAMAGVPVDDLTPYLRALVERGYRVAVADQYETDDGHAREITRVVTPGTLLETDNPDAQYLATIVHGESGYGLAMTDVTTGQFAVADAADTDALMTELYRFDPVEVLPGPAVRGDEPLLDRIREQGATVTLPSAETFAPGRARHRLREHFGEGAVDTLAVAEPVIQAAGAALSYIEESGAGVLASITRIQDVGEGDAVALDGTTQRNLELVEPMSGDGSGTLRDTVDHTVTSAGRRLLGEWLTRPSRDRAELARRQAAVEALGSAAMARERIRETLDGAYDLERLASRAAAGTADARDLRAAADTLVIFEELIALVGDTPQLAETALAEILSQPDTSVVSTLAKTLNDALVADPPGTISQGELFARGYDETLDEIIDDHEAVKRWLAELPDREQRRTGITHLSVDRNTTDGYYIQVGNSETDQVPDEYTHIKSLKNSKRYTTEELEEREREVLRLEERRHEYERDLFEDLRERVADHATVFQDVGRALATVDVLASFATHAVRNDWVRPTLHEGDSLKIEAGRHPVVEQTTEFVPNDLRMDSDRRFLIVTGPNMSGKSTFMRQAALITLLAQVGSFVPARSAQIGLVDGIYTRVGALDELAQGRSTFMVEMQELSNILHSATEDSLVILDEVGRGTATYDGISIAWAGTEYLHNTVGAKTLFATHYHELTTLADHLEHVENVHVAADETDGEVTFLRTVRDGSTDRSYGVHVADLAGVPDPVVDRSSEVLNRLREEKAIEARGGSGEPVQAVFDLGQGEFTSTGAGGDDDARARPSASGSDEPGLRTDSGAGTEEGRQGARPGQTVANGGGATAPMELDDDVAAVLESIQDMDVREITPAELIKRVQAWQDQLEE